MNGAQFFRHPGPGGSGHAVRAARLDRGVLARGARREKGTDLTYVLGLHEGPVVSMADGFARVTGKRGVACLHTTVGTLNADSADL